MSTHKLALSAGPGPEKKPSVVEFAKPVDQGGRDTFLDAMLEMPSLEKRRSRGPAKMAISVLIHAGILAALIVLPLYYAKDVISAPKPAEATYIFTPPPPGPPPPAATTRAPQRPVHTVPKITIPTRFVAPQVVPKQAPETANVAAPDVNAGVPGGVEGGMPGGVLGGVLGGSGAAPGPPPAPKVVRVGGNVKPPQLVQKIEPQYPPVAKVAHVQGTVVIDAIISKDGSVISEHAVSGPGLLIPSALNAVKQWKYKPTYLNGQPVDLAMQVTVDFQLGQG